VRVVFSAEARADLTQIAEHIAHNSPRRAQEFVRKLRLKAAELRDTPRAFPLVPRYERAGIRKRVWRDYLIFYRIDEDRMLIVHVLHGAQDYEALLSSLD
jgi:plasmid stabilization system protein ParE